MLWRSSSTPPRHPDGFIEPCLPTLGPAVPSGPQWVHEIKHDGFRFICRREGDRVRVFSRRGNDYTDRVPAIAKALAMLRVKSVTIDGEGVVCREDGVSDFDRLRAAVGRMGSRDAFLYALTYLKSMAPTFGEMLGKCGGRRLRAFCAALVMASNFPITWKALTARPCSATRAPWGSKASSRSVAIGPIGPAGRRIGSRLRTPTRRPRRE
jgi:ATP dependent DNA ligase domain